MKNITVVHYYQNASCKTYYQRAAGDFGHASSESGGITVKSEIFVNKGYYPGHSQEQSRDLVHVPSPGYYCVNQEDDADNENDQDAFSPAVKLRQFFKVDKIFSQFVFFVH